MLVSGSMPFQIQRNSNLQFDWGSQHKASVHPGRESTHGQHDLHIKRFFAEKKNISEEISTLEFR